MRTTLTVALAVAAILAVAGVAGYAFVSNGMAHSGATSGTSVGTLNVYMQDAPANTTWSHIYVTIGAIQVHPADGMNASDWRNVSVVQNRIDLVGLKSVAALLGGSSLAAGNYTQIRIVVKSVTGVMANNTQVDFTVPSGELKTADAFNITTGETTSLTIDINLARSVVDANGTWIFTPVLGSIQTS